jgi:glucokinase
MPGWKDVPLRNRLAERTGLLVALDNDANVAAMGEWLFGGGQGYRHMIYITISTGIGSGVIIDGRLLYGRRGAGGELGHTLIDSEHFTSWENLASGRALAVAAMVAMRQHPESRLHELATPETVTGANVAYAAEQGDKLAQRLMEREATLLGVGFVNALHTFSPEIILVGGGVVTSNPSLLEGARRVVQQHALADVYRSVPIEVAHLGPQVGVLGAAALVFATPNT